MLTIGVCGVGHLGRIHLKCIGLAKDTYQLAGFFDPDDEAAEKALKDHDVHRFDTLEALIEAVDVVDIVTPTIYHHEVAAKALRAGKHVFIEKPLTHTVPEAEDLLELATTFDCLVQVGHVERFNPALLALEDMELQPMFIEAHRLATFNPRGTDVSVVLDLMIHDLDIVLSLVDSPVKNVHANGVAVVSDTADICNARLEFENGCIANLTASRLSLKQMRKVRFFQSDAYISLDFLEKQAQVVRLFDADTDISSNGLQIPLDTPRGAKKLLVTEPAIEPVNAIKLELESFAQAIQAGETPKVSIEDGYQALRTAYRIEEQIR